MSAELLCDKRTAVIARRPSSELDDGERVVGAAGIARRPSSGLEDGECVGGDIREMRRRPPAVAGDLGTG